jgi:carboxyl-terminal processing protease
MRLTTSLYFTPSGRSIQAEGIEPDVETAQLKPNYTGEGDTEREGGGHKREADLEGHLETTAPEAAQGADISDFDSIVSPFDDYDMYVALMLLKGAHALAPVPNQP